MTIMFINFFKSGTMKVRSLPIFDVAVLRCIFSQCTDQPVSTLEIFPQGGQRICIEK